MTSHSRSTVNQLQQLHTTETNSLMEKQCKNPKERNSLQNLNHQITCFFEQLHHSAEIKMTFNYMKLSHQLTLPKPRHGQKPTDPYEAVQLFLDSVSKRCLFCFLIKVTTLVLLQHRADTHKKARGKEWEYILPSHSVFLPSCVKSKCLQGHIPNCITKINPKSHQNTAVSQRRL